MRANSARPLNRKRLVIKGLGAHTDQVGAGQQPQRLISKDWLQERKDILEKIKHQVRLYLGEEEPAISRYTKAYKEDLQRPWEVASWEDLYGALKGVQVVFGGDFHPFAQAQRSHLRIMRHLVEHEHQPLTLALECVFEKDQALVNQFLKGEVSEKKFLEKTRWEERWGFPWPHYKPLFDFAKKQGLPLLALNREGDQGKGHSLEKRDQRAAQLLASEMKQNPRSLIYVLYGDLHISAQALPHCLKTELKDFSFKEVVIFLNSEAIFFQLAEKNREHKVDLVRFNERHFCLLSSPPWVKWQSYLMYLEENFDVDLDLEEEEESEHRGEFSQPQGPKFQMDYTDHVSNLVKMIATALKQSIRTDAIQVYSARDPQVLRGLNLSEQNLELARSLIQRDHSFYIPDQGFFYLSKTTVNHGAHLAAQYVHAMICGRTRLHWNFPQDFIQVIWIQAMAFLLSQFVNPKRKAQTMNDLKKQLQAFDKEDHQREPLLLALDQKMGELLSVYSDQEEKKNFEPRRKSSYVLAAKFLGEMLGKRYFELYSGQQLGVEAIGKLLSESLEDENFSAFYFQQLKALDHLEFETQEN